MGGYHTSGNPPHPPVRPGRGGGTPNTGGGGYPTSYRITDGVLDTPQSVCLLRSRRRTFLLKIIESLQNRLQPHSGAILFVSIDFNERYIPSVIAELTLTLGVNGP